MCEIARSDGRRSDEYEADGQSGGDELVSDAYATLDKHTATPVLAEVTQEADRDLTCSESRWIMLYSTSYLERHTMQKKIIVRMSTELHEAVNEKAEKELRPVSAIVRRLLEKWLRGEIDLDEP